MLFHSYSAEIHLDQAEANSDAPALGAVVERRGAQLLWDALLALRKLHSAYPGCQIDSTALHITLVERLSQCVQQGPYVNVTLES